MKAMLASKFIKNAASRNQAVLGDDELGVGHSKGYVK